MPKVLNLAETLAEWMENVTEDDGLSEDDLVNYLDENYKGKIMHHKFTKGRGEWTAIIVFNDLSAVRLVSHPDSFDVHVGEYQSKRLH